MSYSRWASHSQSKGSKGSKGILNGKLESYFLSGYSPDLNPDELVWNHLKTNLLPKRFLGSKDTILKAVRVCLDTIKVNTGRLENDTRK
ncbi:transposase [Leptospira weilii]|uniref:transposase n=1 Tax=Leptospira weilii TaxID=28184 RepID=UPI0009C09B14